MNTVNNRTRSRDDDNWTRVRDDVNAPVYENERSELGKNLAEAERLVEEGWSTDDLWPGVIYPIEAPGGQQKRISTLTWMFMKAITLGVGLKSKWDREER